MEGYEIFPSFPASSSASISSTCQGMGNAVDITTGDGYAYAGDATKLWWFNNATTTQAGQLYSLSVAGRWEIAQFNNIMLATKYGDNVQTDSVAGASFSVAITSANVPKAKHIAALRDFVVLGFTN